MTRKQIEHLKWWMVTMVELHKEDLPKKINELDELLKTMFDMLLIKEYKEVEKIRKEVLQAGIEKLDEIRKQEIA